MGNETQGNRYQYVIRMEKAYVLRVHSAVFYFKMLLTTWHYHDIDVIIFWNMGVFHAIAEKCI